MTHTGTGTGRKLQSSPDKTSLEKNCDQGLLHKREVIKATRIRFEVDIFFVESAMLPSFQNLPVV